MNNDHQKSERAKMKIALKMAILHRDHFTCQHCFRSPLNGDVIELHIDHIIPVDGGGLTKPDNLQVLCGSCNIRKSNRILHTAVKKCNGITSVPRGHTIADLILFFVLEFRAKKQRKRLAKLIEIYQDKTGDYGLGELASSPHRTTLPKPPATNDKDTRNEQQDLTPLSEARPDKIEQRVLDLHAQNLPATRIAIEVFGSKGGHQNRKIHAVLDKFAD